MATNFPTNLDDSSTIPAESASTKLSVNHVVAHQNIQDAIEAVEAKVGVDGSAVTTSHDYKLSGVTGSDKSVSKTGTETLTNKTLGTGTKVALGSDAEGDTYYNNSSGDLTRLARGADNTILKMNGNVPNWEVEQALFVDDVSIAYGAGNTSVTQTGFQKNAEKYAADTSGSSTVYVAALSPVPTSLTDGMVIYVKMVNANTTTTPTLNINGLGAKTIVKGVSTALLVGDISANMYAVFIYNGTNLVLQNPALSSYGSQVFTATGSWVAPKGVTAVLVDIVAGGGAGGGNSGNDTKAGGGGGAGAGAINAANTVVPFTSYSVVVGTGGAGTTGNGAGGVASSFNGISKSPGNGGQAATGTAAGGTAGDASAGAGGAGSTSGGIAGTNGSTGTGAGTAGTGGAVVSGNSGGGGGGASGIGSYLPANGGNGASSGPVGVAGQAGQSYGHGGGGGNNQSAGGAGAAGIVVIKWLLSQVN